MTRTPPKITEPIRKLCRELDGTQKAGYIPVQPQPDCKQKECFENVRAKVEKDGGRIQFGWAIWEWPSVMIEAEFHANWISPEGKQIDITPKPEGISKILFLPDSTRTYDYNRDHYRIDNIRRPLSNNTLATKFIEISEEIFQFEEFHSPGPVLNLEGPTLERWKKLKWRQALILKQLKAESRPLPDYSKPGRNDLCSCGSGRKFKKCCGKPK